MWGLIIMKTRICQQCGKEYVRVQGVNGTKYCSLECSIKAGNHKARPVKRVCAWCGKEYEKHIGDGGNKYCSDKCFHEALKDKSLRRYSDICSNNYESRKVKCKWCGKEFNTQYKKSHVFCSIECKGKWKRHWGLRRFKVLRKAGVIVDKDITLRKVIIKYNKKCNICGKEINENDYVLDINSVFRCGKNYPTIDHIIPISKGGLHEWNNIQLAHMGCNASKGDSMPRR
jgi:5-methylcytosine-specific restriction endonuclease McrA